MCSCFRCCVVLVLSVYDSVQCQPFTRLICPQCLELYQREFALVRLQANLLLPHVLDVMFLRQVLQCMHAHDKCLSGTSVAARISRFAYPLLFFHRLLSSCHPSVLSPPSFAFIVAFVILYLLPIHHHSFFFSACASILRHPLSHRP